MRPGIYNLVLTHFMSGDRLLFAPMQTYFPAI